MRRHSSTPLSVTVPVFLACGLAFLLSVLMWRSYFERAPVAPPAKAQPVYVPVMQSAAPVDAAVRTVRIDAMGEAAGSGSPVAKVGDRVAFLTAAHVIDGEDGLSVLTLDGQRFDVIHAEQCPGFDAAIVWARMPDARPLTLRYETPAFGEEVYASGWADGVALVLSHGYVCGRVRNLDPWTGSLTFTAPVFLGNSGGPIFDPQGRVVGVTRMMFFAWDKEHGTRVPYLCGMVPVGDFEKWLAEALTRIPQ